MVTSLSGKLVVAAGGFFQRLGPRKDEPRIDVDVTTFMLLHLKY